MLTRNSCLFFALLVSAAAHAQAPSDAGSLLRQQEQLQQRVPGRLPPPELEETRPELEVDAGETVQIKTIRFSGDTGLVPEAELQQLVAEAIGHQFDFVGLQSLADRVTAHLKQLGWFLARAYLPKQDITEGVIEIAIVAGRLSEKEPVRITSGGKLALRIDPSLLLAIADRALPAGAPANEEALNRAILLMNDLPGITARVRLEPGESQGETRPVISAEEGLLLTTSVALNNYGSRDTGAVQANANLALNDPTGRGDQITLAATASEGTQLGLVGYSLPLGSDGWKLNLGYSDMRYTVISAVGRAAGLKGESRTATAGVLYPWRRSRTDNVYLGLTQSFKHLLDRSSAGPLREKQVVATLLSLSGDSLDTLAGSGLVSWNTSLTAGQLRLDLAADAAADAAGYRTTGRYNKLNYNVSRLQKLPGTLTLFASLSGQQANKNLDSSEKLYLGGPAGVRAYPGAEAGGDSGQIVNLELRYDWPEPTSLGKLQWQAFFDAGRVQLHNDTRAIAIPTASGANRYGIAGAGMGFSFKQSGSHIIRAMVATRIGSNPGRTVQGNDADGRADNTRLWVEAMHLF